MAQDGFGGESVDDVSYFNGSVTAIWLEERYQARRTQHGLCWRFPSRYEASQGVKH